MIEAAKVLSMVGIVYYCVLMKISYNKNENKNTKVMIAISLSAVMVSYMFLLFIDENIRFIITDITVMILVYTLFSIVDFKEKNKWSVNRLVYLGLIIIPIVFVIILHNYIR